jgi:hypothetical protein
MAGRWRFESTGTRWMPGCGEVTRFIRSFIQK